MKHAWNDRPLAENPAFAPGTPVLNDSFEGTGSVVETRLLSDGTTEGVLVRFAPGAGPREWGQQDHGYFFAANLRAA